MAAHIRFGAMVEGFLDGAVGHVSTGEELGVAALWINLLTGDGSWPPCESDDDDVTPAPAAEHPQPKPAANGEERWYNLGAAYWEGADVPPTISGVLGGLEGVHGADVAACKAFLSRVMRERGTGTGACIDCGGGMGRTLRDVLVGTFDACDLVEQSPKLVGAARGFLSPAAVGEAAASHVRHLIVSGLQEFDFSLPGLNACDGASSVAASVASAEPSDDSSLAVTGFASTGAVSGEAAPASAVQRTRTPLLYDVIWLQWVVGTLLDLDLVRFLQRAKASLRPNGVIFVKDNVCREGRAFYYDADDASVTRSAPYLELLFRLAGLRVIAAEDPPDWDAELLPVTHYALAPTGSPAGGAAGAPAPAVDVLASDAASAAPGGGAAGAASHC